MFGKFKNNLNSTIPKRMLNDAAFLRCSKDGFFVVVVVVQFSCRGLVT